MATEEPLSKEGRDLKIRCKAMAFYEARFCLRTHAKEGPKAALVQFLDADGRPITEEHVSPGFSEEVGRYSYLKASPETGAGVVRFFAPTSGGRVTLRFRAWANRHPVLLGHDISVREVAGWTIAAERSNSEPIRLTSVARPLSIPVPGGAKAQLSVTLRSEADGRHIVLHAPCAMAMAGARVRLGETFEKAGGLRLFERRGTHVVLDVENPGQAPVVLSLACEGVAAIDIEDVVVAVGMTDADDLANKAQPGAGALTAPIESQGAKVRWATKVGNRLFLRSTIIDTRQELTRTADKVSQIERTLEESLLLVEKKVDYLLAKIDAYAEVDDRNGAALHDGIATVRKMAQDLGKTADANQAELRSWQEGVDGRLASIERGNADLAGEVSAVRENGEKLGQAIKVGQQATDARLKDVEQASRKISEAVTANQTEFLKRQDGLDVRLVSIEKSGAKLASALDASDRHVKQALKDIGGRTKKLEEMDKRLTRLAEPKKPEPAPIEPAEKGKPTVLVELLGPSGVGKSTILRAAQALRTPEQWWWGADEIDTVISEAKTDRAKQRDAVDSFLPPDFARRCIDIITSSRMLPSQIIAANNGLRTTSQATDLTRGLSSRHPLVHDELLLHRASSMLLHSERYEDHANWYFDTVPIPSAAVIIRAEAIAIVERVSRRSTQRINTYYNLDDDALLEIVNRSLRLSEIAAERLDRRGVTVAVIDAGGSVTESAQFLHDFVFARSEKGN